MRKYYVVYMVLGSGRKNRIDDDTFFDFIVTMTVDDVRERFCDTLYSQIRQNAEENAPGFNFIRDGFQVTCLTDITIPV